MKKLTEMKKLKWALAGMSAVALMSVMVPGTEAGKKWSGVDPIFTVDGQKFNVWIEWPEGYGCSIEGPIDIKVRVPSNTSYVFVSESSDDVDNCGSPQTTETKVKFEDGANYVGVKAEVKSSQDFPVRVLVSVDGQLVRTYEGNSNETIKGKPVRLPGADVRFPGAEGRRGR